MAGVQTAFTIDSPGDVYVACLGHLLESVSRPYFWLFLGDGRRIILVAERSFIDCNPLILHHYSQLPKTFGMCASMENTIARNVPLCLYYRTKM